MTENIIKQLAANPNVGDPITGFGKIGLETGVEQAPAIFTSLIQSTIGLLTIIGGIYFIIQVFTGSIAIISSSGDKGKVEGGRKQIQYGILGMVVIVAAIFLADLVGFILGFNILSPASYITKLSQ